LYPTSWRPSKPKPTNPLEKEIQKAGADYLKLKGHFGGLVKAGGFTKPYQGKAQFIRTARKGTVDWIGLTKTGRGLAVEFKRPGETATPEQQGYLDDYNKRGGLGIVAYSVDDLIHYGL
jgi:hypothetical protein